MPPSMTSAGACYMNFSGGGVRHWMFAMGAEITRNSSMVDFWLETKSLGASLYLLVLVASLIYVLTKIPRTSFSRRNSWVLPLIAGFALYFTCKVKLNVIIPNAQPYSDLIGWLNNWDPVIKTHWAVADSTVGLWWTCQLFMFALTFVAFLNAKARYVNMSVWELSIHVWLSFSGAISISFPLFLFHYFGALPPGHKLRPCYRLPTWGFEVLGIFLWLAYWSIASLPLVKASEFPLYLLLIALFLILPSFIPPNPLNTPSEQGMMLPLYIGSVVLNTALHWFLSCSALSEIASNLDFFRASSNPQEGIFVDFLFSLVVCCLYIVSTFSSSSFMLVLVLFLLFTPVLSLGASFAAVLAYEVYLLKSPIIDGNANKTSRHLFQSALLR